MAAKRERIHFESVEELLGAPVNAEGVSEIKINSITAFENHPFKVLDDAKMDELVESIKLNGVITPVLVRPDDAGGYEMISGHRRLHAAKLAGLTLIPAVVKNMTDDEAVIAMVDGNVQREEILPSERAWSLKMKMDAMRRQGSRTDLTSDHDDRKSSTASAVGEGMGLGEAQVRRYVRLTNLIPELLDLVDEKKITFVQAIDIAMFNKDVQQWIYEYKKENGFLKNEQIAALKNLPNLDNLTQYTLIQVMNDALPKPKANGGISISEKKLNKYFPPSYSSKERENIIFELLERWKNEQEDM